MTRVTERPAEAAPGWWVLELGWALVELALEGLGARLRGRSGASGGARFLRRALLELLGVLLGGFDGAVGAGNGPAEAFDPGGGAVIDLARAARRLAAGAAEPELVCAGVAAMWVVTTGAGAFVELLEEWGRSAITHTAASRPMARSAIWKGRESCAIPTNFGILAEKLNVV